MRQKSIKICKNIEKDSKKLFKSNNRHFDVILLIYIYIYIYI